MSQIDKKKRFWDNYFRLYSLSMLGNEKIMARVDSYSSIDNFYEKNYVLANMPEKYLDFEVDTIEGQLCKTKENISEIEKVKSYLDSIDVAFEKGIGLYLSGSHGVGKSSIAVIILKKALRKYYSCFFCRSTEIVDFAMSGWRNDDKKTFWDYVTNCDFMVVDDIARAFDVSKYERIHIDSIFTKRDSAGLPTIVTANHSVDDNREIFGEALYSNFKERLIQLNILGEDYRGVIGKTLLDELKK